jgi:hypothetical protein
MRQTRLVKRTMQGIRRTAAVRRSGERALALRFTRPISMSVPLDRGGSLAAGPACCIGGVRLALLLRERPLNHEIARPGGSNLACAVIDR